MTDEKGYCTSDDRCGNYVAGPSCKNVEWCEKAHLVEPGTWETEGSDSLTGCMWELSAPPKYGHTDGGYATSYMQVTMPKGAIFSTSDCDWKWVSP